MLMHLKRALNELISQITCIIIKLVLKALTVLFSNREAVKVQLTTVKMYPQPQQIEETFTNELCSS